MTIEREEEARQVIAFALRWARSRPDVQALLLVGSYARGTPNPSSDVDLLVLTEEVERYTEDDAWASEFPSSKIVRRRRWGAVTERRLMTSSGLEVEVSFAVPSWACTNPLDSGTERVVRRGAQILYDPTGTLVRLLQDCGLADPQRPPSNSSHAR